MHPQLVCRTTPRRSSPSVELQSFAELPSQFGRRLQEFDRGLALSLRRLEALGEHGDADLRVQSFLLGFEDARDAAATTAHNAKRR